MGLISTVLKRAPAEAADPLQAAVNDLRAAENQRQATSAADPILEKRRALPGIAAVELAKQKREAAADLAEFEASLAPLRDAAAKQGVALLVTALRRGAMLVHEVEYHQALQSVALFVEFLTGHVLRNPLCSGLDRPDVESLIRSEVTPRLISELRELHARRERLESRVRTLGYATPQSLVSQAITKADAGAEMLHDRCPNAVCRSRIGKVIETADGIHSCECGTCGARYRSKRVPSVGHY